MAVFSSSKDYRTASALIAQAVGSAVLPEHVVGKRLVIKLGGRTLTHQRQIVEECLWLRAMGASPVIVHGGGPAITACLHQLHIPSHFKHGLRVTDAPTLDVVRMVLCGQINPELVALAAQMSMGEKMVGLNGVDAHLIQAHITDPALGLVGEIDAVSPELIALLLTQGYLPILAPLAQGSDGTVLNVNADLAAAALAKTIHADTLLFCSDVAGVCRADGSLITDLAECEARLLLEEGIIRDGMIPKVQAALSVIESVPHIQILDGQQEHSLLQVCFHLQTLGTTILPQRADFSEGIT
jgi:acetylglutamate kinase